MQITNLNKRLTQLDRSPRANYKTAKPKKSFKGKFLKFLVFLVVIFAAFYLPLRGVYSSAKNLSAHGKLASAALKDNNLDELRASIKSMNTDAASLNRSLGFMIYLSVIPYFGGYYGDIRHFSSALSHELSAVSTLADGLDPYKADLGFTGSPVAGQDKVAQMVKILDKILPNMDKVSPDLKAAQDDVAGIDVNKYPETLGKFAVRSEISTAKNFIIGGYLAATQYRDAMNIAPKTLGEPDPKTYLILFQNDKELRATGGFMTAYAFLKLDHGHISSTGSDDIYRLDEKLLDVCKTKVCPLTPPAPIVKYLPEADGKPRTAWSMRDSNLSPDLPTSMKQFESMYSLLGEGLPWDGVITIDTEVVRQLIAITGPVDVFGTTYSADIDKRCNCPNVVYELESYSEVVAAGQSDRKAILGTLMQQVLAKALTQSTTKMPELINAAAGLAAGKHMMFYMHDSDSEQAFSKLNWTGQVLPTNGDYLEVVDTNFAGAKSNLYVSEEAELDIDKSTGAHKLTISYSNPQPFNSWLNAINRDYLRIYVPLGSKLTSSNGSDVAMTTISSELGKTAFEAFIQVRPQNSRKIEINYTLPSQVTGSPYPILVQKQPGTKDFHYTVKVNGQTKSFDLSTDQDLKI